MATARNIEIYQGDDYLLRMEFWLDEAHTLPADVSARVFTAQLRPRPNHPTKLADFAVDMSHAAEGRVDLTLTAVQTAALRRDCSYDVQQVAGGVTTTPFYGRARIVAQVTV